MYPKYSLKFVFLFLLISLLPHLLLGDSLHCDKAITQLEIDQCAEKPLKEVEEKLKQTIQALQKKKAADAVFLKKLGSSQKAWEEYMAAQMEVLFPAEDKQASYGSVFPMCWTLDKKRLILERVKELESLLKEPMEGDVCGYR